MFNFPECTIKGCLVSLATEKYASPNRYTSRFPLCALKEEGYKVLTLETDYEDSDAEQLRTRVSAFLEMIESGNERK